MSGTAQERFGELSKYDRLDKICEKLADIFVTANKASKKEVNNLAVSVYKINYDWQAEQLGVKGTNKAESKEAYEEVDIFDTIAFAALTDKKSIEREIKSKIVQALMSKAGVRPIITAIKNVAESNLSDNVRIATTATTQTENKGRADVVEVAKNKDGNSAKYGVQSGTIGQGRHIERQADKCRTLTSLLLLAAKS